MRIDFLNVGYGEAIVIRDGSFCMVVDGGSDKEYIYQTPSAIMLFDFLKESGIQKIDRMVLTHIHDDHVGGLVRVMEEIPVGELWVNILPEIPTSDVLQEKQKILEGSSAERLYFEAILLYFRLLEAAEKKGVRVRPISQEDGSEDQDGLIITPIGMNREEARRATAEFNTMIRETEETEFLKQYLRQDRECNTTSLALHIRKDGKGALLTGDKVEGWEELAGRLDLRAQVLKLTHHGQMDGMPEAMLQAADPDIFVICADENRTYNSAAPEVLERITAYLDKKEKPLQVFITGDMEKSAGDSGGGPGSVLTIDFSVDPIQPTIN
jgi:competence protein ComEC